MNPRPLDALQRQVDAQTARTVLPPARRRGVCLTLLRLARRHRPATPADLVALAEAAADRETPTGREMLALLSTFPDETREWGERMLAQARRRP